MVSCEMCGTETASPNRVKIEGAELQVCDDCTEFGTELQTDTGTSSTSTKYSTGSGSSGSSKSARQSTARSSGGGGGGGGSSRRDMFDEMDELAEDYDDRIRKAREQAGLSQDDLARKLNEKASLLRKLEHGKTLPSDDLQRKLEHELDIDLSAGGTADEEEWSGGSSTGEYTLGDMVERKDT